MSHTLYMFWCYTHIKSCVMHTLRYIIAAISSHSLSSLLCYQETIANHSGKASPCQRTRFICVCTCIKHDIKPFLISFRSCGVSTVRPISNWAVFVVLPLYTTMMDLKWINHMLCQGFTAATFNSACWGSFSFLFSPAQTLPDLTGYNTSP